MLVVIGPRRARAGGGLDGCTAGPVLIGSLFAILAMVGNTAAGLLQSDATTRTTRRRPLAVQPLYLVGLLVDGLAWVATVVALRFLPVFAVQAILGGAIALTALSTRLLYGSTLRRVDWVAVVASLVGLVLVAGSAGGETPEAVPVLADLVLLGAVLVLGGVLLALRNVRHSWPLALIAGLGFGGTSLAVRAVHEQTSRELDIPGLLTQPAIYLVLGFWLVGMVSYAQAIGRGDLSGVTGVFAVTEVVAPGLVGIGLLGDPVRPGWTIPLVVGLALAVAGVAVLAGSPAQRRYPERRWVR